MRSENFPYRKVWQFDTALNDIDEALKRHPDWPPAVRLRSMVHAAQGKADEQLKDYAELIRMPNDSSVYEMRARVFERKGKSAEAIKDYSRAIETNPLSVAARLGRGTCLFRDGDYENALSDLSAAVNADHQNVGVYRNRAKVLDRMGRWEEELKDIDRILLALPTDAKTLQLRKDVVRRLAVKKEPARMARDDMYQVYSAVLLHPIWNHAEEAKMFLIQRTSTGSTYNSRPPAGCVQPPPRYEKMFEEILEDYRKQAGETVTLEPEFAFDAYVKKMRAEISATEGVQNISIVRLGFDGRDFAVKGDRIWEPRVMTVEGLLRAIIWVHPFSEQVHFVCGPWRE